jgi:ABC-type lipoprotein export system ATPase subunit
MLQTRSIEFGYSKNRVFHFPDITLDQGDECLLLGSSGSGKTTLLHIIGGLLKCQAGHININGSDLSSFTESQIDQFRGRHVGFIFQRNHLIPALTVIENLLMPTFLSGTRPEVNKVSETLDLLDLNGLGDTSVRKLSHGQAQRVAIARAIMNRPYVLLADEPTSALDDENCERVISLLSHVVKIHHSILLIATHDQRLKSIISKQVILSR